MSIQLTEKPGLAEWRQIIGELYEQIREWTSELEPTPSIEEDTIAIIEKWSGEYQIARLIITQGDGKMTVDPVARAVIGASGMVQLHGLDGPFDLIYYERTYGISHGRKEVAGKPISRGWYWEDISTPSGREPLNGQLFRDLAESCLR